MTFFIVIGFLVLLGIIIETINIRKIEECGDSPYNKTKIVNITNMLMFLLMFLLIFIILIFSLFIFGESSDKANEKIIKETVAVVQDYKHEIEKNGYLTDLKAKEIKSILEKNNYIFEVDGTKNKVKKGEDVYLNINIYKTGLFNTYKIKNILVTGKAK